MLDIIPKSCNISHWVLVIFSKFQKSLLFWDFRGILTWHTRKASLIFRNLFFSIELGWKVRGRLEGSCPWRGSSKCHLGDRGVGTWFPPKIVKPNVCPNDPWFMKAVLLQRAGEERTSSAPPRRPWKWPAAMKRKRPWNSRNNAREICDLERSCRLPMSA